MNLEELTRRAAVRQAAEDEDVAAVRANELGLSGREAEAFKGRFVAGLQKGREAVRQHVAAVLESPEGQARPTAARDIALRDGLTTDEAIAKLADEPEEDEDDDDVRELVRRILEA